LFLCTSTFRTLFEVAYHYGKHCSPLPIGQYLADVFVCFNSRLAVGVGLLRWLGRGGNGGHYAGVFEIKRGAETQR